MSRIADGQLRRVVRRNTGLSIFVSTESVQNVRDVGEKYFRKNISTRPKIKNSRKYYVRLTREHDFLAPDRLY